MHLDNAHSPSTKEILEACKEIFQERGEDAVMDYLIECASHDFRGENSCFEWACSSYEDYKEEIEGRACVYCSADIVDGACADKCNGGAK